MRIINNHVKAIIIGVCLIIGGQCTDNLASAGNKRRIIRKGSSIARGNDSMATSDAKHKVGRKYINEKLDEIRFRVPKGERDIIKKHAEQTGESVNKFIYRAVKEAIKRDNQE